MAHDLKTIATFNQTHEAYLLEARLEQAGITTYLSEETILGQIDGITVRVDEGDYANALELYRLFKQDNEQ